MFGALIRAAERWRGLRFTEFELRQIAAVRNVLDAEYDGKVTRSGSPIPTALFQQIRALTIARGRANRPSRANASKSRHVAPPAELQSKSPAPACECSGYPLATS